ncbi:MAG: hypothetical protein ACU84Q_00445 [Gammaproteobacteria bacterium]
MNIGNLSEIVGAVAVVASVIYLALQIKKQTEEARLEASRDIASDFIDTLRTVSENPELAKILPKGVANYDALEGEERLRVNYYFAAIFRIAEQQFLHTTHGSLDSVYFESFVLAFRGLLSNKGPQQWWGHNKDIFAPSFQAFVQSTLTETKKTAP